jgi:glycosyltransferase involved in cell wall biosynthesis
MSTAHNNYWEARLMVETFMELGYTVDVIDHLNSTFVPKHAYSAVIDCRSNLEKLVSVVPPDCVKMMYLDTAHLLFNNAAEAGRLLDLQRRRGVTLPPRRFQPLNFGIEAADCAVTSGNEWTISTYAYARKQIYRLPVPASVGCGWPGMKDWDNCRRHFLWFNSGGFVHKGLDLVLEAFAGMPDYHLTICGPISQEPDFAQVYRKELYETPNILTVGWIDSNGPRFAQIAGNCAATILCSCSEGANGSVVNCMHAGLIPILTRECGLDVGDFGFLLRDCSVEHIRQVIARVGNLPVDEMRDRARTTWEFARATHTRARYAATYKPIVTTVLGRRASEGDQADRAGDQDLSIGGLRVAQ